MGAHVGKPTEEQAAYLEKHHRQQIRLAAEKIREADVLVLHTGAGFSADSGLAVYKDIAAVPAYKDAGLKYHDLCKPTWIEEDPEIFYGFWGMCFNDYRKTKPHDGFDIIRRWRDAKKKLPVSESITSRLGDSRAAGAFFAFTSNVDAHHYDHFEESEIHECHGNVEVWQCSKKDCGDCWRVPVDHAFVVDKATMRAPKVDKGSTSSPVRKVEAGAVGASAGPGKVAAIGQTLGKQGRGKNLLRFMVSEESPITANAFSSNHPICPRCKSPARPSILMFDDWNFQGNEETHRRITDWRAAVLKEAEGRKKGEKLKVVIVEIGAGNRVPTVRGESEGFHQRLKAKGAEPCLVRISPDLPVWDDTRNPRRFIQGQNFISVLSTGLDALQKVDNILQSNASACTPELAEYHDEERWCEFWSTRGADEPEAKGGKKKNFIHRK